MKLYELTEQLSGLAELGEDIPPEALRDTLDALQGEFDAKAVSICHVLANASGSVTAIDSEIKRLQARKKAIVGAQDSLKDYLRHNMLASGITKIESPLFNVTLLKPQQIVVVDDIDALPEEATVTKVTASKTQIKGIIMEKGECPGAHMEEGKAGIRIS